MQTIDIQFERLHIPYIQKAYTFSTLTLTLTPAIKDLDWNPSGGGGSHKRHYRRSIGEIIIMIIKYALVHALSLTQIYEFFNLINCIFDEAVLPTTKYLIDKLFCPRSCVHLHAICNKCGAYIGTFKRRYQFVNCSVCKAKINVSDNAYKDFFVMLDVSEPISKLIESNSEYYNYVTNDRVHEKGTIRDIYTEKICSVKSVELV